jgi:hypothetical protein
MVKIWDWYDADIAKTTTDIKKKLKIAEKIALFHSNLSTVSTIFFIKYL